MIRLLADDDDLVPALGEAVRERAHAVLGRPDLGGEVLRNERDPHAE
jgi:hypothetical protein